LEKPVVLPGFRRNKLTILAPNQELVVKIKIGMNFAHFTMTQDLIK